MAVSGTSVDLFFEGDQTETGGRTAAFVRQHRLKILLVATDSVAILAAFSLVVFLGNYADRRGIGVTSMLLGVIVVLGLWAIRSQGLLLARVSAVRVVEITRLARATALLALLVMLADRVGTFHMRIREALFGAVLAFIMLVATRSAYRSWLRFERTHDRFCRRVVVAGTDEEAARLVRLFETHHELGIRVVAVTGDRLEAQANGLGSLWVADAVLTPDVAESFEVSGVVVSPLTLAPATLNNLLRDLPSRNMHVHLATGVAGIASNRLRSLPLAYEPLLYVEPVSLSRVQTVLKRLADFFGSLLILVLTSPVFAAVALAIKWDDRGPVFFRQERVGRNGTTFGVLKFRTMVVDAEARLAQLQAENERRGPLFKMDRDPRVTRIGRFLRATSLDELPQLINVLRGEMSLVGPRPALPSEVEEFSIELRQRERVLPGITGLWQMEARDNPSFEAYRRLDLFYVENWSLMLDFIIVLGTVEQLVMKVVLMVTQRRGRARAHAAHPSEDHARELVEQ